MNKTDRMELLIREMLKTYWDKNADYGDSFSKLYQEFGLTAPIIRMSDNLERLKTLSKAGARVKDESIRDTLIDLGNHAFMTALELENDGSPEISISPLTEYEKWLVGAKPKKKSKSEKEYTEEDKLNI